MPRRASAALIHPCECRVREQLRTQRAAAMAHGPHRVALVPQLGQTSRRVHGSKFLRVVLYSLPGEVALATNHPAKLAVAMQRWPTATILNVLLLPPSPPGISGVDPAAHEVASAYICSRVS